MRSPSNNMAIPSPLMHMLACVIVIFVVISLILHVLVELTLKNDNFSVFQSSFEMRRNTHNNNNGGEHRILEHFQRMNPPNMTRTRKTVEALRRHSPVPVTDEGMDYDVYNCPNDPPQRYPFAWRSLKLLKDWNPNNTTVPQYIHQGLCVFDYNRDLEKATRYRDMELPFVLVNTPEIFQTAERWNSPQYLSQLLAVENGKQKVEHADNPHFMYWKQRYGVDTPEGWKKPTDFLTLTFSEWLSLATNTTTTSTDLYYFRYNADPFSMHTFLYDELPFFQPTKPSFFMVDPEQQRGINCRFGMTGILAEAHYDSSRNFIVVLGGSRRYILAHPSQCLNMALYPANHPSGRHSEVDWTNLSQVENHALFSQAQLNEVVLQAGDALYLPTHWFHFIQSLDLNYQCNARSGITKHYVKHIKACGFAH